MASPAGCEFCFWCNTSTSKQEPGCSRPSLDGQAAVQGGPVRVAAQLHGSRQAPQAAAKPLSAPLYPSAWQTARGGQRGRPWVPLRPAAAPLCTSPYLAAFGPRARPRRPLPLPGRGRADSPPQAPRPARPRLLDVLGASRARDGLGPPALLLLRDVVLQSEPQPSAPTPGSPRAACCPPGGPRPLQPRRAGPGFARDRTTGAGASKGGPEGSRARTERGSGRGIARAGEGRLLPCRAGAWGHREIPSLL